MKPIQILLPSSRLWMQPFTRILLYLLRFLQTLLSPEIP
nr:MAG TPA: hypothetical protein [Caudoviricetes sp.]